MNQIRLYNSLTRQKEDFTPIDPDHVKIYACGPTVYSYAHIGNARMAVVCDLMTRVIKNTYPKVTYVSNITDVDDKIINASIETGEPISTITQKYERIYNEDMAILGVDKPDIQPRATEYIGDMIALIEQLVTNDCAYEKDGHVLFHVPAFKNYGKLSGRSRDEQIAGARVEIAPYKKDAADFVLWKPSTDNQPGWDSPWGYGRPGWHVECSAMSEATLGLPFDIHGGGADLKFPHHENEIAQSCGAHNHDDPQSFAKTWVHNGFVTVEGEKMSKSLGNIQLVHDLVQHYPGETLRLALLTAHYRQPLNWTRDVINQSHKTLDRYYRKLKELSDIDAKNENPLSLIIDNLNDDLNTPKAIASLNQIISDKTIEPAVLKATLIETGRVLNILQNNTNEWLGYNSKNSDIDVNKIENLIEERKSAKKNEDFAKADEIRATLKSMNIEIEDTRDGTIWKAVE